MTRLFCSITLLLLITGLASTGRSQPQQKPEDEVLAQGNPPLTLARVDQLAEFFEWALDSKLTKSQRTLFTARLVEIWEKRDQSSIDAFMNMRKSYDGLVNATPEQRNEARGKIQTLLLDVFVKNSADSLAQLLLSVYKASHPGAVITPQTQSAVNPTPVPASGVPAELVGEWIARRGSGSSYINPNTGQTSGPNATIDSYKIFANGTFEHSILMQSSLYNCTTTIFGRETGPIVVQGATFTINRRGTIEHKNNCSPSMDSREQTNDGPKTLSWRIQRGEYGLELCMRESDGSSGCYLKQ